MQFNGLLNRQIKSFEQFLRSYEIYRIWQMTINIPKIRIDNIILFCMAGIVPYT